MAINLKEPLIAVHLFSLVKSFTLSSLECKIHSIV